MPDTPALVHGMGKGLVEPDWPPLTEPEVTRLLSRYAAGPGEPGAGRARVRWRSPRPMSAAALVRGPAGDLFVKRHDTRVRDAGQLAAEHAVATYLRGRGVTAPAVLRTAAGQTTVTSGRWVYEVHETAPGEDVYRDAPSWSPFASLGHARAAGAALARLHLAALGCGLPARPFGVLTTSCEVITAAEPLRRVAGLASARPGLGSYLASRPWADDLAAAVVPAIARAAPLLAALPRQWGHGDWHPSNLTWTSAGPDAAVVAVFDFGLANLTFSVHDLAVAIERACVAWLDLSETGRAAADLAAAGALLDGYQAVRPLTPAEAAALPWVLPVAHVEYALSEVEYFAAVLGSPGLADLAYHGYLLAHARWFTTEDGRALLGHLRRCVTRRPASPSG